VTPTPATPAAPATPTPGTPAGGAPAERVGAAGGGRAEAAAGDGVAWLVVGVGACQGTDPDEIGALIDAALAGAGLPAEAVRQVATVDVKSREPGIVEAAAARGWAVIGHPAAALAGVAVPNPSELGRARVGTPSVAEAAALYGGPAELLVPKRKTAAATVAVARHTPGVGYRDPDAPGHGGRHHHGRHDDDDSLQHPDQPGDGSRADRR